METRDYDEDDDKFGFGFGFGFDLKWIWMEWSDFVIPLCTLLFLDIQIGSEH